MARYTLAELEQQRGKLVALRTQGVANVRDSNGESITYRSDGELARAIDAVDREIAALSSPRAPSVVRFNTSKGI